MGNKAVGYHRWMKTFPFHGSGRPPVSDVCRERSLCGAPVLSEQRKDIITRAPQIILLINHQVRVPGLKADKLQNPRVHETLVLGSLLRVSSARRGEALALPPPKTSDFNPGAQRDGNGDGN